MPEKLKQEVRERKQTDIDLATKVGAVFLDALFRLSHSDLTTEEFDLLQSRLRKLPGYVEFYLVEMSKNARKPNKNAVEEA